MAKLHLIGNAHIDPVWLWRWQEGFGEVLMTFRSVLERMKEFPELKFVSACALYYEWVERMDPEMFEEIRQRVAEGRWEIVGGWMIQPDCNLPSGESFARHGLLSQRYFREKFGVTAKTGYNVDSFGHNASLPMILNQSGMTQYVFMRPNPEENGSLADLFLWESADGSRVVAHRIIRSYGLTEDRLEWLDRIKARCDRDKLPRMAFCGLGNHGGGPSIRVLEQIREKALPDTGFTTVGEYFATVDAEALPVHRSELQHHAIGCYSACSAVKRQNRQCEENLILAEKLAVMAKKLTDTPYPHGELNKAWKTALFNQFHDIMGGCSIESAYTDAAYGYGECMSITERVIYESMQRIGAKIDTLGEWNLPVYKDRRTKAIWSHESIGSPVAVFNPHARSVRAPVEVNVCATRVTDERGQEVPFQLIRGEQTNREDRYVTLFLADLDPYGYAVYRVFCEEEPDAEPAKNSLHISEHILENDRIRVELDEASGELLRIYDKQKKQIVMDRPCATVLLDETDCDTWAHGKSNLGATV